MSITVICPGCGKQYKVDEAAAGKRVRCKGCGGALTVPQPEPPPGPDLDALASFDESAQPMAQPPAYAAPQRVATSRASAAAVFAKVPLWAYIAGGSALMAVVAAILLWPSSKHGSAAHRANGPETGLLARRHGPPSPDTPLSPDPKHWTNKKIPQPKTVGELPAVITQVLQDIWDATHQFGTRYGGYPRDLQQMVSLNFLDASEAWVGGYYRIEYRGMGRFGAPPEATIVAYDSLALDGNHMTLFADGHIEKVEASRWNQVMARSLNATYVPPQPH